MDLHPCRFSWIFVYFRGWGVVAYVAREVAKEVAREVVREVRRSATVPALGISALFEDS